MNVKSEVLKFSTKTSLLDLATDIFLELPRQCILIYIFIKLYANKYNSEGVSSIDAFRLGHDSRVFNNRFRLRILIHVAKLNCGKMIVLFSYLNFVFNSTGKEEAVQTALEDWFKHQNVSA